MSIELILCAILMLITFPISSAIGLHFGAMFGLNLFFLGYTEADQSLLAICFAVIAVIDVILSHFSGRSILLLSALAMLALSLEAIGNGDWLLSHSTALSIAVNATIIVSLAKEFRAWMCGRSPS